MKQISLHNSLHILAMEKRKRQIERERERVGVGGRETSPTPIAIWHGHKSFDICVATTI